MDTIEDTALTLPDGSQITLRHALMEDVPAIVDLLVDDPLGHTRDGATRDGGYGPYERAFAEIATEPNQHLVVATDGRAVIGTFQLTFITGLSLRGTRRAQIEGVRVAQTYRSCGLGTAMMRWAISESAKHRCTLVQLTSDKTRTDAHRFYERLGFQATHEGYKMKL
ncbi:GNAT family N-acetyltransferase [Nocardia jiangxiensis]|uniref:GNAT family N-acetyltransferase n=1 Tax=Nocardia jiangxiensis TaxID=282685 RepID=A0ABW6SE04_9NOCA|nr:GNAT family N-acetyltransferase [Nocardia jiangxiensis]